MKYTVLTPDSAVKFFGDPVALSSIISFQSIQKNYNYNTNLQVAFSEQRSETLLESTTTTIQKRNWFQASTFPLPLALFSLVLGWKVGFSEGEDCRAEGKCVAISVTNCDLPPALIS